MLTIQHVNAQKAAQVLHSWGKQFVFWLSSKTIKEAYNSFGNGSAMRVSACAWLAINHEHAIDLAVKVSEVTHNHSEGIKGACAITSAIFLANEGRSGDDIKKAIEETYKYDLSRSIEEIRLNNPHSESCQKTNCLPQLPLLKYSLPHFFIVSATGLLFNNISATAIVIIVSSV